MKVYICTDDEQMIGARVAKFLICQKSNIKEEEIEIINEKNFNQLDIIKGRKYLRNKKWTEFRSDDMQRFTLLRYAIPELMGYKGEALVIDPDIFLVRDKLDELMPMLKDNALICRAGKQKGSFATSLMLLNSHKLQSWNLEQIIDDLINGRIDYSNLINLRNCDLAIGSLSKSWNDFDNLDRDTIFLHTTQKVTQPWRKDLPMNSYIPPLFGFLKRDFIYALLNKPLNIGVEHPNPKISKFFFKSLSACISNEHITIEDLKMYKKKGYVRSDIFKKIDENLLQ